MMEAEEILRDVISGSPEFDGMATVAAIRSNPAMFGVVNVTKAALPVLRRQRSGHFIQFSSIGGRVGGTPGLAAYQAAKWAVEGFSEVLSNEVKPFGVKVTIIEPGGFRTEWGSSGATLNGKPVIVLTFKAAKSGKIRKKPLMRIKHNGTYAVVASFAGGPKHPLWYRDIVANPIVELQDGAVKQELRAREVFGSEKDEWWTRADAAYSEFPAYRARAGRGGREIPVVVLEPL